MGAACWLIWKNILSLCPRRSPRAPDLSYDSGRGTIETSFDSSFSGDGDGPDVNWAEVLTEINEQIGKTRDIWLAVYMMRAGAQAGRLDVITDGAELLAGYVELFWDSVHPQLEELGLTGRITPCGSLARISEFLGPLRRTILVAHPRLGSYSGADFERFEQNGDSESDYGMFQVAMRGDPDKNVQAIPQEDVVAAVENLDRIKAALKRTDAAFAAQADGDGPNFQATYEALDQIRRAVAPYAGLEAGEADGGAGDDGESWDAPSGSSGGGSVSGRVESREDVIRVLDAIADYYRRKEPSSPVPVVLRRARQWVTLDFLDILEDIAPAGIDDAKRVLVFGKDRGDESSY